MVRLVMEAKTRSHDHVDYIYDDGAKVWNKENVFGVWFDVLGNYV